MRTAGAGGAGECVLGGVAVVTLQAVPKQVTWFARALGSRDRGAGQLMPEGLKLRGEGVRPQ
jgi:hypothetical protein